MNKEQQATSTAGFQPGDQVRFLNGYEKTFIGDGIFTVINTEERQGRTIVKLKGIIPKFDSIALEKANAEVMDVETMFKAIEYCFTEESCQKCPLAGERESCPKKWQEALKAFKEQVEKDVRAYKTELAVFNTFLQNVILKNDCATCYINKKCPIREDAEKNKERCFDDCVAAYRAIYATFYDINPEMLEQEISGSVYREDKEND